MKFKEYLEYGRLDEADNKFHYIVISLDSNLKKSVALGFKEEKNADKMIEEFENVSDVGVFSIENVGYVEENKISKLLPKYNIVMYYTINTDKDAKNAPDRLIRRVYGELK